MSDNIDAVRSLFATLTGQLEDMSAEAADGQGNRSPAEWRHIAHRLIEGLRGATEVANTILKLTNRDS